MNNDSSRQLRHPWHSHKEHKKDVLVTEQNWAEKKSDWSKKQGDNDDGWYGVTVDVCEG